MINGARLSNIYLMKSLDSPSCRCAEGIIFANLALSTIFVRGVTRTGVARTNFPAYIFAANMGERFCAAPAEALSEQCLMSSFAIHTCQIDYTI